MGYGVQGFGNRLGYLITSAGIAAAFDRSVATYWYTKHLKRQLSRDTVSQRDSPAISAKPPAALRRRRARSRSVGSDVWGYVGVCKSNHKSANLNIRIHLKPQHTDLRKCMMNGEFGGERPNRESLSGEQDGAECHR